MPFSLYLHMLSLRQKIVIILLLSGIILSIIYVCIMRNEWIFSLMCGCISYILLIIVTFKSISTKIMQKIHEAHTEQNLLKYSNRYDETRDILLQDSNFNKNQINNKENMESINNKSSTQLIEKLENNKQCNMKENNINNKSSKKEKKSDRLKFLDLSKISLGFELSFSLPRIFVFIGIIICCVVLVWFKIFYPLIYIFGVFIGIMIIMCFLFVKQWRDDFIEIQKNMR